MDPRPTQTDLAGMAPFSRPRDAVVAQEIRLEAARARDQAISRGLVGAFAAVGSALRAMASTMASIGARARAERELHGLSDRELADIGLTRGEIAAVLAADSLPGSEQAAPTRAPAGHFARAA